MSALQFKITLEDIKPPIWRRVKVPLGFNLNQLHQTIQLVFDWQFAHMHGFMPFSSKDAKGALLALEMQYDDPVQLYYEIDKVTLREIFLADGYTRLRYVYDYGDNWVHLVTLEEVLEEELDRPVFMKGKRMAPFEDCGGVWGFSDLLEALQDPEHSEHEDVMDWLGLEEGDVVNPAIFDDKAIEARLASFHFDPEPFRYDF